MQQQFQQISSMRKTSKRVQTSSNTATDRQHEYPKKVPSNATYISENGVEIQHNISTSVSDPVPDPVPSPDFPFLEFPLTEVVNQSQIDFVSISDTVDLRETDISTSSSSCNMDFQGKSQESAASHEEMRDFRDLTISAKHT